MPPDSANPLPQSPTPTTPAPLPPPPVMHPPAPEKDSPPQQKQQPAASAVKSNKALPHVVVLDFYNLAGAPAKSKKIIAERLRYYLLDSKECTVVDAGETCNALPELCIGRSDSITQDQIMALGQKLGVDYVITGFIAGYREGDIEYAKNQLELMGKLFSVKTGKLEKICDVKRKSKDDVQNLIDDATERLAAKLLDALKK